MEDLRIVKNNEIKVFIEATGQSLYTVTKKGYIRDTYYLINDSDIPVAISKSNFFKNKWVLEDIDNGLKIIMNRNLFGKIKVNDGEKEYLLERSFRGELQLIEKKTSNVIFKIDTTTLLDKKSVVIENNNYLNNQFTILISVYILLKNKIF